MGCHTSAGICPCVAILGSQHDCTFVNGMVKTVVLEKPNDVVRKDSLPSVKEDHNGSPQSFIALKVLEPQDDAASTALDNWTRGVSLSPVRQPTGRTLESLPAEILDRIMTNLALDVPPSDFSPRNRDLVACLLTSRRLHRASEAVLYRRVTLPHGRVFSKFLGVVQEVPELGELVRRLDLSHLTSIGLGRTRKNHFATGDFTRTTFGRCLELLPNLQEVLLQEHLEEAVDANILQKIFWLPRLRALDLCGMGAAGFADAFSTAMAALRASGRVLRNLQNLCLHECGTLLNDDIEILLARVPRLKMLDLHHTAITEKALLAIPETAALTHLNLGRCSQITGGGVVEFFQSHPAVRGLVYLNLGCDLTRYRLLREDDTDELLPALPPTLRSLNLNGAALQSRHLPTLVALSTHLEELGISHTLLSDQEVRALVGPRAADSDTPPSTLRYIDCTGMLSVTQAALFSPASTLLSPATLPLEVIEVCESLGTLAKAISTNARLGWVVKAVGRRSWYVRKHSAQEPQREWKMGSHSWGMRKVPVVWSDVGGIYGHYMFKA